MFKLKLCFTPSILNLLVMLLSTPVPSLFSLTLENPTRTAPKPSNPVIMIPGDGGSQLMAKLNKTTAVHFLCTYTTDYYFTLWLNLELLAPYFIDCTVDNLRLVYNPASKKTSNSPGVKTALPQFGDPDGVEFLDPSEIFVSSYYAPLGEALRAAGYENNKNLFGTAYDFRKAPDEMQEYFTNLTKLIESSYAQNGKPALVVAHSLGNMVFTYFLSTMPQDWKDKYVAGYVAVAAPLGGAAKLFRLYVSGDALGERFISALSVRRMQRTFPSSAFLIPYAGPHFWDDDFPFVITPKRNYSISNLPTLAKDIGFPYLYDMRKNTEHLVNVDKVHPGVPVYCVHGWNISTPLQFNYTEFSFPDEQPEVAFSNGDGTVNDKSLQGCDLWSGSKWKFEHIYLNQAEHLEILDDDRFISYVKKILKV